MVLIHDRIIIIDICNFEMSYKTPEKSLKSNQIYSVAVVILGMRHLTSGPGDGHGSSYLLLYLAL